MCAAVIGVSFVFCQNGLHSEIMCNRGTVWLFGFCDSCGGVVACAVETRNTAGPVSWDIDFFALALLAYDVVVHGLAEASVVVEGEL